MCSASLTAIHEACEHLLRDECELAIAGGVNLYLHPSNYILLCMGRMLSRQGQCKSFGRGGDGMAPGEGVGTVLLKRLSQAEADGDHIYGVIKGSSINHGGKTNGYTVPNPTAQKEVVRGAISRAGVDARAISYIEAHGTGTELGDPIEIAGLTQAFREYTTDQQFCAIGSAKSNIGHCESAAGIAGLTKVLMQMKYGQLAPSLHTEELNPNIDFEKTPFVVQRELGEWKRPRITAAGQTRERPRMAGISSFGAGGANAHLIVEEYVALNDHQRTTTIDERQSSIIVLSAKTEDQLKSQARNLVSAIHARRLTDADLPSVAYTLQTGREAMEERVAVIVNTTKELEEKLQAFAESRAEIGEVYRGQVRHGRESLTLFVGDEEFGETINKWIQRGKLGKLADLWVKGFDIDWNKLYAERKPRRISLPTYPFAREHYWLPVIVKGNQTENGYNCGNADSKRSDTSVHENIPGRPAPEPSVLLRYVEEWKPRAYADIPVGDRPIQLIHFTDDEQLSSALARLLEGRHDQSRLIRVVKGSQFRRLSSTLYELPAEGEDGFRALWDSLGSAEKHHGAGDWAALYSWGEGLSKIQGLHSLLKTGLRSCLELKRLIITGAALDDLGSCYDLSLIGYERSLRGVAPQMSVTILYGDEEGVRAEQIWQNLWRSGVIRFQGGSSYELGYRETSGAVAARPALRKRGVYLITGGGGGLGKVFAGHLAQAYQARLALVGRSPVDEEKQEQLRWLKTSGAQDAAYYSADVCDRERMREVVAEVKERWGEINGVIHCAGLESKKALTEKEWEEFRGILSPKVEGTRALDEVTAEVDLDFVCYFSSSSAILGDVGGCDYAIGNRYQMAYGAYRERERGRGKRRGQTLVMNWPLWREGGMGEVGSEPIEMYLKSSGQRYLESAEGIEAWEDALSREARQEMILVGQPAHVERFLFRIYSTRHEESLAPSSRSVNRQNGARSGSGNQGPASDSATLRRRVVDGLKERIGELLKIKQGQLNEKTNFADFGFDSIGLAQFSRVLTELYGFEVGPNVFFNYSTVERLSEHLIERHRPALEALY